MTAWANVVRERPSRGEQGQGPDCKETLGEEEAEEMKWELMRVLWVITFGSRWRSGEERVSSRFAV